jgi:hypothetical protein
MVIKEPIMAEGIYVLHFCKNRACNIGWLDIDKNNAQRPPQWRYCPECKASGHKNPKKKPLSPAMKKKLEKARASRKPKTS